MRPADQWVGGLKACRAQVASVMREDHANGGLRDKEGRVGAQPPRALPGGGTRIEGVAAVEGGNTACWNRGEEGHAGQLEDEDGGAY